MPIVKRKIKKVKVNRRKLSTLLLIYPKWNSGVFNILSKEGDICWQSFNFLKGLVNLPSTSQCYKLVINKKSGWSITHTDTPLPKYATEMNSSNN